MTTSTALVPVEKDAEVDLVKRQVEEAERQADLIEVTNPEQDAQATAYLQQIKARLKAAEDKRKELTEDLLTAKRKIDKEFKDAAAPYDALFEKVKGKVTAYRAEQERIRKAEEERLERERQERERKIREERERQEAEARALRERAEKEAREAEEERLKAKDEEDRQAAEALAEEARQKAQEAQTAEAAIEALPEVQLPKAVVEQAATPSGAPSTKRWDFAVTDLASLPTHLPDGEPLIEVKSGPLRRYMHAYIKEHGRPPEMAGIEFKKVDGLAVRSS